MRLIPGGRAMKLVEDYSIKECGVPSLVLQERAALAVRDEALRYLRPGMRAAVVCGVGNNGADGLAAARLLTQAGYEPDVIIMGDTEKRTPEFAVQMNIITNMGVRCSFVSELGMEPEDYDLVIDALFGIGLSRDLTGSYAELVDQINAMDAVRIAVDIPSGIDAETGAVMGKAVRCDATVTFTYEKLGTALWPGAEYAGRVVVKDVGHLECDLDGRRAYTYGKDDLDRLPIRPARSHKGTFGKVLVIAGSAGMCGAAHFAAKAAYRTGAGLVYILTPEQNRGVLQTLIPEAIVIGYHPDRFDEEKLAEIVRKMDAVVMGPGMGRADYVKQLVGAALKSARCPVVIDADGLNAVADEPALLEYFGNRVIVTPHVGEMATLTSRSAADVMKTMPDSAISYARASGAVCVLKDARTIVSNGTDEFYINMSGDNGMATGGSGDALSGIIGALLAAGMTRMSASVMGVYIHGLAGEAASAKLGTRAVMAGDIIEGLAEVLKEY